MNEAKKIIGYWFMTGCFMILIMVLIGGITRLTGSGLSMVEWKVIGGTIPPLNEVEWQESFEKYQQFPEAKLVNQDFTLSDYKSIFFWEYLHRMWGRLIGMVFLIPFLIFLVKGWIIKPLIKHCILLFFLGGLQGFIGWFMVKSGLVDVPHVSHYRLTIHLLSAFGLYLYLFWLGTNILFPQMNKEPSLINLTWIKWMNTLIPLTLIQIIYGAFMSGLKAGFRFTTFPLMNGDLVPHSIFFQNPWYLNFIENLDMIQFIHRLLGTAVFLIAIYIGWNVYRKSYQVLLKTGGILLISMVVLQFTLGIITVMSFASGSIPVEWASAHQIGALLLLTVEFFVLNRIRNIHSIKDQSFS